MMDAIVEREEAKAKSKAESKAKSKAKTKWSEVKWMECFQL
jgi:hypothetical protein